MRVDGNSFDEALCLFFAERRLPFGVEGVVWCSLVVGDGRGCAVCVVQGGRVGDVESPSAVGCVPVCV